MGSIFFFFLIIQRELVADKSKQITGLERKKKKMGSARFFVGWFTTKVAIEMFLCIRTIQSLQSVSTFSFALDYLGV